jgi:trans-aconitate methyltransferase
MTGPSSQHIGFLPPWDGAAYADNTAHHRVHDAGFLAALPLRPTDRVLDLGCGAGDFTAIVAALVPDGHVVGLDAQLSMIDEATARAGGNQSFVVAPAQHVREAVGASAPFDLIFSRSVLHWVPWSDHPSILEQCRSLLRPGGPLRIECGGGDNVREVVSFLDDVASGFGRAPGGPWSFVGAGAYLDLLLDVGFVVDERGFVRNPAQRRAFDRESILGWLHSQCLHAYEATIDPSLHAAFRAAADERIDELRRADGTYDLTFVRLDVLAFAP